MSKVLLTIAAGALGGVVGMCIYWAVWHGGFLMPFVPGGSVGVAAAMVRSQSKLAAILCGVLGVLVGIFNEWWFHAFVKDPSFSFFISNLHQLNRVTWLFIILGGVLAAYLPWRRDA